MSKNSAFARVIELTRTLSPFERGETVETGEETAAVVATAIAEEAAEPGDEPAPALSIPPKAPTEAELNAGEPTVPALKQVTLVAIRDERPDAVDKTRQAVTDEAIEAIEADIASLIAGFEKEDRAAADEADEPEQATMTLLSELDRLWRADPAVGNGAMR